MSTKYFCTKCDSCDIYPSLSLTFSSLTSFSLVAGNFTSCFAYFLALLHSLSLSPRQPDCIRRQRELVGDYKGGRREIVSMESERLQWEKVENERVERREKEILEIVLCERERTCFPSKLFSTSECISNEWILWSDDQ